MAAFGDDREPLMGSKPISEEPPEIRSGFIAKVYGILSAQLVLTAIIAAPFVLSDAVKAWVALHGLPLVIGVTVLNIGFLISMVCCEKNLRTFPTNYLLLAGFTVSEGVLVGVCCAFYSVASVLLAVVCTAALVGSLTAYAMYTKTDFTGMGPYLFAGCMVLIFFGIFLMFLPFPIMHKVYCCLGILLFSFYLIFDTQMIVGKGQCSLGVDDYVFGALQLYIDIIQIFLYILSLVGDRD
mmetsp:Transcript_126673/g.352969  ORF Transcript_126673/g.352969 Transcript_126673/m.352969 type:complete len:239 (+) Transcript_126673:93-809(+)|eukprot:CAMPEP_0179018058 /NCGR_PEP_ID=MMETSP0796-20121207/4157_1 /TAXON_ID=73915 /ORGANISM="Pyrodinium bahamense, Strain pbaha01" /LENGTH=238 /DNA_ID=CAMNT_0020713803 /DNA_START=85 /DNA_END=801 /DNA_ORIENTATION=-